MKKIDIYSDASAYAIGSLAAIAFFIWIYPSLSPGWRFLGVSFLSLVIGIALQVLILIFNEWRSKRIEKKRVTSMCRTIAVNETSTDPDDTAKCWRYMISRYSNELITNRLSDLVGFIVSSVSAIVNIGISIWYFGMIAYFVWNWDFTEPLLLFIPIIFRVLAISFELFIGVVCNVLFNRYPGEAKRFNKKYDELRKTDQLLSSKEFRDSIHS